MQDIDCCSSCIHGTCWLSYNCTRLRVWALHVLLTVLNIFLLMGRVGLGLAADALMLLQVL